MINHAGLYSLRTNTSALETSLFNWMLTELDDILLPDSIIDELIDPGLMNSMTKLEEHLSSRFRELEWNINLLLKYDTDIFPSEVSIEMTGAPQQIKFAAGLLSQYLVKNSRETAPLGIRSVLSFSDCMKVELSRSNTNEARKSLITFFGKADEAIKTIKSRPAFWKMVIRRHLSSNYNMVTVHRNYIEDLLADKVPTGEITVENMAKKPIQEIPLKEMLFYIKDFYETSRIAENVDIDGDTIMVSHNYRSKEATDKLKKCLVALLETNGHLYDAKSTANMIVLVHRPEVGIKINEIVANLKTSSSSVDQELIMFLAFLKGLKDIPDIPISLTALGKRIGESLMKEYEKENGIKGWSLENFQKALEIIDSKLHRESEWKLEGKNLLYTIRKCSIVTEGNTFDEYVCHTARGAFKGALSYAFGKKAELKIMHLLTHGDKYCEVVIRVP